jgi:hypothetical protein
MADKPSLKSLPSIALRHDVATDYSALRLVVEGLKPKNPGGGPESRLWAAVVERAHGCANGSTRRRILRAVEWLGDRYLLAKPIKFSAGSATSAVERNPPPIRQ